MIEPETIRITVIVLLTTMAASYLLLLVMGEGSGPLTERRHRLATSILIGVAAASVPLALDGSARAEQRHRRTTEITPSQYRMALGYQRMRPSTRPAIDEAMRDGRMTIDEYQHVLDIDERTERDDASCAALSTAARESRP